MFIIQNKVKIRALSYLIKKNIFIETDLVLRSPIHIKLNLFGRINTDNFMCIQVVIVCMRTKLHVPLAI